MISSKGGVDYKKEHNDLLRDYKELQQTHTTLVRQLEAVLKAVNHRQIDPTKIVGA